MRYPDEFNTPTFPAGPRIASSRTLSIAIMTVFFLIICSCGLLLWVQRSAHVHPFLVSINSITGNWEIIGHQHGAMREMSTTQTLQESVIGKFIRNWFWIADNTDLNTARWNKCDRTADCTPENKTGVETGACGIYCLTGDDMFSRFNSTVKPEYQARILDGETCALICHLSRCYQLAKFCRTVARGKFVQKLFRTNLHQLKSWRMRRLDATRTHIHKHWGTMWRTLTHIG